MLVSIPENTAVTKTDTVLAAQSCRHAGKTDDEQAIPPPCTSWRGMCREPRERRRQAPPVWT